MIGNTIYHPEITLSEVVISSGIIVEAVGENSFKVKMANGNVKILLREQVFEDINTAKIKCVEMIDRSLVRTINHRDDIDKRISELTKKRDSILGECIGGALSI